MEILHCILYAYGGGAGLVLRRVVCYNYHQLYNIVSKLMSGSESLMRREVIALKKEVCADCGQKGGFHYSHAASLCLHCLR